MKGIFSGIVSFVIGMMPLNLTGSSSQNTAALISPVVSVTPTIIVTPPASPSAVPTASISATPSKKPKIIVTASPTPTSAKGEEVSKFLDKYSLEYGLDPNVVRHLARCESGFRTNATNGKYVGLFQYDSQTWIRIRTEMGLSTDPDLRYSAEEAIKTTSYALSKGRKKLWPKCVP